MSFFSAGKFVRNAISTRAAWLSRLLDPRRDIDKECGHPEELIITDFKDSFRRGDIAARVVRVYPEETWANNPEIYETEDPSQTAFETAWEDNQKKFRLFAHLQRIDILSGVGRFGVLLIGVDDNLDLDQPIQGIDETGAPTTARPSKIIYLRAFDESTVAITALQTDPKNPRFGLPTEYSVQFVDAAIGLNASAANIQTKKIHWSRVLHVADNRMDSDIVGRPRMELVMNRLLDLKKILGGSGEMFWKGGFPGYSLEAVPGPDGVEIDIDEVKTKEQMEAYMNGLQRYIATTGLTVKSLNPQVADPTHHVEVQIRMIAMALSIPWRILMGVEVGQLASEQDIRVWNRRLARRQNEYVSPYILRPFIDRLIAIGVLPPVGEEGVHIDWPDLNSPTDSDKAEIAAKRTSALAQYVSGGVDVVVPPFHFLTLVLGFSDEEATSIIDEAGGRLDHLDEMRQIEQQSAEASLKQQQKVAAAPLAKPTAPGAR